MELRLWGPAEQAIRQRLRLKESPQQYVFLAYIRLQTDRNDSAAESCIKAIELDPTFSEAYYNLGFVYRNKEQINEAIAAFKKAVELDNEFSNGFRELGLSYFGADKLDQAKEALETCLTLNPKDGWAHFYLALCSENAGDLKAAAGHYEAAIKDEPEQPLIQRKYQEFVRRTNARKARTRPSDKRRKSSPKSEPSLTYLLLKTKSGRKVLGAAAKHFASGERFTRADLARVLNTDEATVWAWIRQLGRPEKRLAISVLDRHGDGSYSVSDPVRTAILKILGTVGDPT